MVKSALFTLSEEIIFFLGSTSSAVNTDGAKNANPDLIILQVRNKCSPYPFIGVLSSVCFVNRRFSGSSSQSCGCRKMHSDVKLKDPFMLAQKDLKSLYEDIRKVRSVAGPLTSAWDAD